ncbi:MAG: riboflavin biosynthesis protein RibF [Oscillospiraceae bacterium]|nr:riboflavin biosynthesis protein RibF [Oscillospiraceae bacterium]
MHQELHEAPNPKRNPIIAALGVFDGVHLGHRQVLAQAVSLGACHVVTFSSETMTEKRGSAIRYIYHDEQRRRLLTECGAAAVYALPFGEIADLDGEHFCKDILRERLQIDCAVVGADYRFGKNASCGIRELQQFGKKYGFQVQVVPQLKDDSGKTISSSHIRFLLESGQIQMANQLLGADYQILAHIVSGQQIGSTKLNIPTANQAFEPWQCLPRRGVYASFSEINEEWVPSITNIGVRPTVNNSEVAVIAETHLLDWSGELNGTLLPVTLCQFIRPEKPFSSLDTLKEQIQRDIQVRKQLLPAESILHHFE